MERFWLNSYPHGVPHNIDPSEVKTINQLFKKAVKDFPEQIAFENMGATLGYTELDELTDHMASFYINKLGLKPGDRIAIQLPNLLQFPVAMFGALKAGLVVVNTNPLYTQPEMIHQFKDSGAKALVILENFADKAMGLQEKTDIKHIIVTGVGDLLDFFKGSLINVALKLKSPKKGGVPKYNLPGSHKFNMALKFGATQDFTPHRADVHDIAFLQYTGGTTGVSKGAVLTHSNVVSNMLQIISWISPYMKKGEEVIMTPLPLYHIFSLTLNCLGFLYFGGRNVLVTNPRDIKGFIKIMKNTPFTCLSGVNTLFNALLEHKDFKSIDFSRLTFSVAGGMALQSDVAHRWMKTTETCIVEGYGLTETSPVVSVNPLDGNDLVNSIGLPIPSTEVGIFDEQLQPVPLGEAGELCVRGPQVMKGYWKRDDETDKVMFGDGWFRTGDIALFLENGFLKIVDRKKDMILVSGFNVYPNEIEEALSTHPEISEVAAIGIPDARSGEAVKVFIVTTNKSLTLKDIRTYSKNYLTGYKVPDFVEFRDELPKSNVGKILRRKLRDEDPSFKGSHP